MLLNHKRPPTRGQTTAAKETGLWLSFNWWETRKAGSYGWTESKNKANIEGQ